MDQLNEQHLESYELDAEQISLTFDDLPLLPFTREPSKNLTLVLDIDETLISVRRWIDEVQIGQQIQHLSTSTLANIIDIHKQVTVLYDNNGMFQNMSFHFTSQQPFETLSTALDINDRINICGQSAIVISITTLDITFITNDQSEIQLRTIDDSHYLKYIRYSADTNSSAVHKFLKPDLIFEDIFIVRFRPFLVDFFIALLAEKIEIILWTAALRSLYTPLMCIVHQMLMDRILAKKENSSVSQTLELHEQQLWSYILYRDNCSQRSNGTYFKNLSQIGRDLQSIAMVDNIWQNFSGFETNGLPIIDFHGHSSDNQLLVLANVFTQISTITDDIRQYLHSYAKYCGFNAHGISQMMSFVHKSYYNENVLEFDEDMDDIELEIELENLDLTNIANELQSLSSIDSCTAKTDDLHSLQMQSLEDVQSVQHTSSATDDESVSDFESDFADNDDNYDDKQQMLTNAYATFDDMNDSTPNITTAVVHNS